MCQLLGMNANTPTDVVFSFTGFATRAEEHKDGFGIAFFEDKGVRLFVDAQSARDSPVADMVRRYPIRSENIVAHIRKATQGKVALANTHPFVRELWGRYWVFAHNGDLKNYRIPNAVTIDDPGIGKYNNLINKIQNNDGLRVPVIDIFSVFQKVNNPKSLYRKSDTHWNAKGFSLWIDNVNIFLKEFAE